MKSHSMNSFHILFYFSSDEMVKFPDYPSDEEGGSAVIFDPELQAQYRGEMIGRADSDDSEDEEEGGGKKDKEKDKKGGADGKKGDAAKEEEEDTQGYKLGRSEFVKGLREADREFHGEYLIRKLPTGAVVDKS